MNKILAGVISIILFIAIAIGVSCTAASEAYIPSDIVGIDYTNLPYEETDEIKNVRSRMEMYQNQMATAHQKAEAARALGYSEDHAVIQEAKEEWNLANANYLKQIITEEQLVKQAKVDNITNDDKQSQFLRQQAEEKAKWDKKAKEHPTATKAWLCMKNLGWNDTVCAGIMGNLMLETGGGTLNINHQRSSSHGFGLVQWIGGRRTQIINKYGNDATVEEQIQFIYDELYGKNGATKQVTDKQLNAIINAESPEACAFAFASYYERCAVQYRAIRKTYARTAFEYFTK